MANDGDYLERLWAEVINLDPDGKWIDTCVKQCRERSYAGTFGECAGALDRLRKCGASMEDLGRVCRFVRYETCFGTLYNLGDPGLEKGKVAGLHEKILASNPQTRKGRAFEPEFFDALWEMISPDDDGEWLADLAKKKSGDAPFDDTGAAVKLLMKQGATARELGGVAAWHRFDACFHTLRLLQAVGIKTTEEADGLYELLLGADPSGKEGRPGSWPPAQKKSGKALPAKEDSEPLWRLRPAQALDFSPDEKTVVVAGASGPVRLVDLATGEERRSCEGLKVHIYRIAFSPDGRQVTAGKIHKELTVCDSATGKLIHKLKRTDDEISSLIYAPTGEIVCASWHRQIFVWDSRSGKELPALTVGEDDSMVYDVAFSTDGRKCAALWFGIESGKTRVTIWSWPDRKQLLEFMVPEESKTLARVPGQPVFAVADAESGVLFFDANTGKRVDVIKSKEIDRVAFTPDGKHFVTTDPGNDALIIWNAKTKKEIRRLDGVDSCTEMAISTGGRYLGAITSRGALVWNLSALLQST